MLHVGPQHNRQISAALRVFRGRSAGSPQTEARAGRAAQDLNAVATKFRISSRRPGAASVRRSLSQRRGVERVVDREDNHAKSTSARVLLGPLADSPRGETRVGCATRKSNVVATTFRSRSLRPGAVSVKKSLDQQHRENRAARWSTTQPRRFRAARRVLHRPSLDTPWWDARAGRAPQGSNVLINTF